MERVNSFFTAGGMLPILNFIFALSVLLILYFEKKKHQQQDKIVLLRHMFIFFSTLSLVLLVNAIIVAMQYNREYLAYFCNMLIAKSYLLTTALFVVLMQETEFIDRTKSLFPSLLLSFTALISIVDLFFVKVSAYWTQIIFGFLVVSINMMTYLMTIVKAVKKSKNSHFFKSKARISETILFISVLMIINYLYVFYQLSAGKPVVMYMIMAFLTMLHIAVPFRIIMGAPSFIVKLDQEETPYPILPALSEDYFEYGTGETMQCRLYTLFETEKPYLSPDLSIAQVAEKLYTNKSYLSKILNVNIEKNFNEFVNHYRVREAMKIFTNNNSLSLQELCRMSGFRNIASFTNAFRLHAGKTPGEWCRMIKNGGEDEKAKGTKTVMA